LDDILALLNFFVRLFDLQASKRPMQMTVRLNFHLQIEQFSAIL